MKTFDIQTMLIFPAFY